MVSLFFSRRKPGHAYTPSLSVLISAYNEERNIRKKIEQTLRLNYPASEFEVVVASDGSTDQTDEIVQSFKNPRVRLMRIEGRHGKTHVQNEAVKVCKGEIVVFSDSTTVYHQDALRFLAANYQDSRVGSVSGRYQYFDANGDSPTALGTISFWNYENAIKLFQSRINTITGCCGCIYSTRKGIYANLPDDVISDLVQPLKTIQQGYRVVFEEKALAYEETTLTTREEFKMRVRVATRGIRGVLCVPDLLKPWRNAWVSFQLFSHKILRWLVPFFLLTLLISNTFLLNRLVFKVCFAFQIVFYLLALVSLVIPLHRNWKLLGIPLYFCTLNLAAFVSVIQVSRGEKYIVWETVRRSGRQGGT
jgi:cellulose synthase/poly-beta-1,6-N-acetylglucosamine synthase-like glycosyltransferase